MDAEKKRLILERAKKWWKKELLPAHKRNTVKLVDPKHFNENPFLRSYLAYFLEGNNRPESIAKAGSYFLILSAILKILSFSDSNKFLNTGGVSFISLSIFKPSIVPPIIKIN